MCYYNTTKGGAHVVTPWLRVCDVCWSIDHFNALKTVLFLEAMLAHNYPLYMSRNYKIGYQVMTAETQTKKNIKCHFISYAVNNAFKP